MTTFNGDNITPPVTIKTPYIEESLKRDEQTNELYLPLTSSVVLKRKKKMLYMPPDLENNLTKDALVDSVAYAIDVGQNELDRIQQLAPNNIFKIDNPPNFEIKEANGRLQKRLATFTLNFDIGDNIFAERFVLLKNLTGPFKVLHFIRNNSVVIDTTHGLKHYPHLTMQFKTAASETSAKLQSVPTDDTQTKPPRTLEKITASVDHPSEWKTTGTLITLEELTETASFPISRSMSTTIDKKLAVTVTNTTESISTEEKDTNCRVLRSHPGAIQVHQTGRHGNLEHGTRRWYRSDYLLEQTPQNEQTRTAKYHFSVSNTKNSWQNWRSQPNIDTNPQWNDAIKRERETHPAWRRTIPN